MNFCFVNLKKKGLLITFFLIIDLEINPFGGLIICFKNGERFMLCVSNSHKHKEANLKKKSRIPLCALSAALLVSLYIFFRKRVNCSRPPNSLIWRKTRPIHVLVVICRNCRREKSPYPNGPTWVAPMFEGVQGQGDLQDHGIYI